ncbi:MAG TPA: EscU/YscU/HrcU family type III secretion system export apparatus switch protein [Bryobacteraceae bacterium]|nr:EscU/YscU/HrcU family type III secretion system export apparatus switch protein [Bryobacteraceae bacterium]
MADNKTEQPTKKRLEKARKEGQFLSARELVGALQFLAVLMVLGAWLPGWWDRMRTSTVTILQRAFTSDIGSGEWPVLLRTFFTDTLTPLLLVGLALALLTLGVQFALTKMGFSLKRAAPNFNRFNPVKRLQDLPKQNVPALIEAVLLLAILGLAIQSAAHDGLADILRLPLQNIEVATGRVAESIRALLWKAGGLFLVFGAVDLFRQHKRLNSSLKMSKDEVRRENKEMEGDPQIKARIRRLRRDLSRRRMMQEIPKATAVIVNPTHFAVAIRYDVESMASPVVVAKGKNYLALRIRQRAIEHNVPIVENPPLARAMYEGTKVGQAIPAEFYRAVAEILAYIYKIMGRKVPTRS